MIKFTDPNKLLPSDLINYVHSLHEEMINMNKEIQRSRIPDTYVINNDNSYVSEKEALKSMEIGDVVGVSKYVELGLQYAVKISDYRMDFYDSRIEAEGIAMIHNRG